MRRRLARGWRPHLVAVAVLLLLLLPPASVSALQAGDDEDGNDIRTCTPAVVVNTCDQLRWALSTSKYTKIFVNGRIECSSKSWPGPVRVDHDVAVEGLFTEPDHGVTVPGNTTELVGFSINWRDLAGALVAAENGILFFKDLLMYQDEMGSEGIDLPFVSAGNGATVGVAGVIVVTQSCALTPDEYSVVIGDTPRANLPSAGSGPQSASSLDPNSLNVENVAVVRAVDGDDGGAGARWVTCNSVFMCDLVSRDDPLIGEHFARDIVSRDCRRNGQANEELSPSAAPADEPQEESTEESQESNEFKGCFDPSLSYTEMLECVLNEGRSG